MKRTNLACTLLACLFGATSGFADETVYSPAPATLPPNTYTETNFPAVFRAIVAPRAAIDLAKEWDVYTVKSTYSHTRTNANGRTEKIYIDEPLADTAEPTSTDLPWTSSQGVRDRSEYLRRTVTIPSDLADKSAVLRFEYIADTFSIAVNGVERRFGPTYGTPFDYDVTELLRPGRNDITLHFYYGYLDSDQYLSDRGSNRGVLGAAVLEFRDPIHIEDVRIETRVVPDKVFVADVTITNGTDKAASLSLSVGIPAHQLREKLSAVLPAEGIAKTASVSIPPHAAGTVRIEEPWETATLWNPDEPNLYYAQFRLDATPGQAAALDALRVRFGFRQFEIRGHRFVLNDHPFIARSGWSGGTDHASRCAAFRRMKARGVDATRVFVREGISAVVDAADEEGVFIATCVESNNGGAGWEGRQNPHFWGEYDRNTLDMVRAWRNHPSVILWGLGCEFGAIYCGEGSWRELSVSTNICATGARTMALDPTRTWAEYGGVEVGCPVKGPGPAPTRSFHYPFNLSTTGFNLPDIAYWYPDGKVSWHRIADFRKPTVIPEDLYHGMMDSHTAMAKWAGDAIYTERGYLDACRYAFSMFAEGYYAGGLAYWEPWMTWTGDAFNRLFVDGYQVMPDFLVAARPFGPNLRGGETDSRSLYVYNQTFTRRTCELRRTDTLGGKVVGRTSTPLALDPGGQVASTLDLAPPPVSKPTSYTVVFELRDTVSGSNLTTRTFSYAVFPSNPRMDVPGKIALLAPADSPLARLAFPRGQHDTVADAIASGADGIVIARALAISEGKRLNDFVQGGGRVLALELPANSWSPLVYQREKPASFVWRRNFHAMPEVQEAWLRSWRPDGTLGDSSLSKSGVEDMAVLFDSAQSDGLSSANVAWLFRGKGAWLLCQLPLVSRLDVEPCAPSVLVSLLGELAKPSNKPLSTTFSTAFCDEVCTNAATDPGDPKQDAWKKPFRTIASSGPSYDLLFEKCGILHDEAGAKTAGVLFLDASAGLTPERVARIDAAVAHGAKVFVSEIPETSDTNLLARFGIRLANPLVPEVNPQTGEIVPDKLPHTRGSYPHWIRPTREPGILDGLSADDFVWYPSNRIWEWGRTLVNGTFPPIRMPKESSIVTARIELLPGSRAHLLSEPAAIAEVQYGKGTVYLSTLRFRPFFETYSRRIGFVLRTILNNLGCRTSVSGKVYEPEFLDISSVLNRNLWNDPAYKQADGTFDPVGWFGGENDMRYFPVNLCGWSTMANNFCPKGTFPADPIDLGGKPFKIVDPETNGGRAVLVLEAGESATITLPAPCTCEHVYLLGAAEQWDGALDIAYDGVPAPETYTTREHFNGFRFASTKTKGVTAWVGETPKDATAGLWFWRVPNPHPGKPISTITLRNVTGKDNCGIAILAVTAEHEVK